jgi:hypothetical protein
MQYLKRIIILCTILVIITGCGAQNPSSTQISDNTGRTATPGASPNLNVPTTQTTKDTYPGPLGAIENNESNPGSGNPSSSSTVPTPSSGKAVVFGEVNTTGDTSGLNISNLFLTPLTSAGNTEDLSAVTYVEGTDPSATLDNGTGQFIFADVNPGQYALMIWTSMKAYPLGDNLGKTIIFTVGPDETKDLGVITVQ